eukprot:jgi/Mesen1/6612/ME000034S06061
MTDGFTRALAQVVVSQICETFGFYGIQRSAAETLADIMLRYIGEIGEASHSHAELAGRTESNLNDVLLAFSDLGCSLNDLMRFVEYTEEVPFARPIPRFPIKKKPRVVPSSFYQCHEKPPHDAIPAWLPAFPDKHTYVATPVWPTRQSDPRQDQIEVGKERRRGERSLIALHRRMGLLTGGGSGRASHQPWGSQWEGGGGQLAPGGGGDLTGLAGVSLGTGGAIVPFQSPHPGGPPGELTGGSAAGQVARSLLPGRELSLRAGMGSLGLPDQATGGLSGGAVRGQGLSPGGGLLGGGSEKEPAGSSGAGLNSQPGTPRVLGEEGAAGSTHYTREGADMELAAIVAGLTAGSGGDDHTRGEGAAGGGGGGGTPKEGLGGGLLEGEEGGGPPLGGGTEMAGSARTPTVQEAFAPLIEHMKKRSEEAAGEFNEVGGEEPGLGQEQGQGLGRPAEPGEAAAAAGGATAGGISFDWATKMRAKALAARKAFNPRGVPGGAARRVERERREGVGAGGAAKERKEKGKEVDEKEEKRRRARQILRSDEQEGALVLEN